MNSPLPPPLPAPAAPRRPVLLALGALVLGTHLWLLAGMPLLSWSSPRPPSPDPTLAGATPDGAQPLRADARPAPAPAPMQVSAVRWITPPPAAKPAPVTDTPRPAPRPAAQAAAPEAQPSKTPEPAAAPPAAPAAAQLAESPADSPAAPPDEALAEPAPPAGPDTVLAAAPTDLPPAPAEAPPAPTAADAPAAAPQAAAALPPGDEATVLLPALPPDSAELHYEVRGSAKGLNYSADARLRWQHDGARYDAELELSAFLIGSRVQTSRGQVGPYGLMPERFGDRRRGNEKAAHFDAERQRIRFSNNAPDAPLLPGAQDRLSVFLQLAAMLRAQPQAFAQGSRIPVQVAGTGSAEVWRFDVGPLETLDLPAGKVSARKLSRPPRSEHDSQVEIWLAPRLQFLPVRIRLSEDGGASVDQLLRELPGQVR